MTTPPLQTGNTPQSEASPTVQELLDAQAVTFNAALAGKADVSTVKVYRALMNQTGSAAPVATVLENTLGDVPVWSRSSAGNYVLTLAGAFPTARTWCSINSRATTGPNVSSRFLAFVNTNADTMNLLSIGSGNTTADGLLNNSALEILVYPAP